ncbi:MAG: alpha/beta hydrolase [Candidatus Limnocylindria bacterium]
MDQLDVGGLRVAYERKGAGPPLVLLHGFVGDSREWRPQIDALSDAFTVVAWDAPGSGRSSDPPESFRMADYADCLAGLVQALHLGRPHVVGLSFGGALALELYRRHPGVPSSLVLASAYAGWTGSLAPEARDQRLAATLETADLPSDEFVGAMIGGMFSETAAPQAVDGFAAIMAEFHPSGFRTMARALAEADLRDVLPHIEVPTLLLYGDRDVRAPLAVAEDLHSAIPNSRLVVLPGVGHMSSVESAQQFTAEVRGFLQDRQD